MAQPAPEAGADQEAQRGRQQETALVGIHLPDVDQEEERHAEGAESDKSGAGSGQTENEQQKKEEPRSPREREPWKRCEMREKRRHHRQSKDGLIGKGGAQHCTRCDASVHVLHQMCPARPAEACIGDDHAAVGAFHRGQDGKIS